MKKYKASDFDLKVLQRVRFWIEKKYNALDFELKFFHIQKITYWFNLFRENDIFTFFLLF